jgi:hypothetical protein
VTIETTISFRSLFSHELHTKQFWLYTNTNSAISHSFVVWPTQSFNVEVLLDEDVVVGMVLPGLDRAVVDVALELSLSIFFIGIYRQNFTRIIFKCIKRHFGAIKPKIFSINIRYFVCSF